MEVDSNSPAQKFSKVIVIGNAKGFTGSHILKMSANKDCRPTRACDNLNLSLGRNPIHSFIEKRKRRIDET